MLGLTKRVLPEHGFADVVVNLGREPGEVILRTAFKQDAIQGHLRSRSARLSSSGRQ